MITWTSEALKDAFEAVTEVHDSLPVNDETRAARVQLRSVLSSIENADIELDLIDFEGV